MIRGNQALKRPFSSSREDQPSLVYHESQAEFYYDLQRSIDKYDKVLIFAPITSFLQASPLIKSQNCEVAQLEGLTQFKRIDFSTQSTEQKE